MGRPRVLFASDHCCLDPSSGAAVSTLDLLGALAARGWQCGAYTGPHLDDPSAHPIGITLRNHPKVRTRRGRAGPVDFAIHTLDGAGGFPITVFAPVAVTTPRTPNPDETAAFLAVLEEIIKRFRPDVVLTYGGDPASRGVRATAGRSGARVVFRLHNFAYRTPSAFEGCDAIAVPSQFSKLYHQSSLGVDCAVVPPVIDPVRVRVERRNRGKYLTFVNPTPEKGVFHFARIAEILGRERPDIPMLVVEGRGRVDWLGRCGIELSNVASFHRMANTSDPKQFYGVTRLILMPSVCRESFGMVAVEAMLNGIPVIASDRGALPEAVGSGGTCLAIPQELTPESRMPASASAVASWLDAIQFLWDDKSRYDEASRAASVASTKWHPDRIVPLWEQFLTTLSVADSPLHPPLK